MLEQLCTLSFLHSIEYRFTSLFKASFMESIYSAFSLDRKELHKLIMMFKRHLAKKFDASICKIRVMPGGVEFSTAGIYLCLNCETVGLYEILVPLKLLFAYSSHGTQPLMSFTFREGEMTCGNSIY